MFTEELSLVWGEHAFIHWTNVCAQITRRACMDVRVEWSLPGSKYTQCWSDAEKPCFSLLSEHGLLRAQAGWEKTIETPYLFLLLIRENRVLRGLNLRMCFKDKGWGTRFSKVMWVKWSESKFLDTYQACCFGSLLLLELEFSENNHRLK